MRPWPGRTPYPPRVLQEGLPARRTTTAATWARGSPRRRQSGATERRTKPFGRRGVSASLRRSAVRRSFDSTGISAHAAPRRRPIAEYGRRSCWRQQAFGLSSVAASTADRAGDSGWTTRRYQSLVSDGRGSGHSLARQEVTESAQLVRTENDVRIEVGRIDLSDELAATTARRKHVQLAGVTRRHTATIFTDPVLRQL